MHIGPVQVGHLRLIAHAGDACQPFRGRVMQRGHSEAVGRARICALVEEKQAELFMTARRRDHQRVSVERGGLIDARPRGQKHLHGFDIALLRGEQQRSKAALGFCANFGPVLDQHALRLQMIFGRCPHQSRLPAPRFSRVHLGALGD